MNKFDAIVTSAMLDGIANAAREILTSKRKKNTVPQGWHDD